ncbi:hypothetical protein S245_005298 [Arachis hypogaea]|uniref:Uncharacterized protein n=1 Tax=Arachis hypogaea TaxID=3818 RepID=A0A445EC44_ARAHY|nr:hypothetical protein Ahy_A02g007050 [Arachis hypogaea]
MMVAVKIKLNFGVKEYVFHTGELWEAKDRICKASIHGNLTSWDFRFSEVKSSWATSSFKSRETYWILP